jgi:hypothetical protein
VEENLQTLIHGYMKMSVSFFLISTLFIEPSRIDWNMTENNITAAYMRSKGTGVMILYCACFEI